jgi:hypothetical protein
MNIHRYHSLTAGEEDLYFANRTTSDSGVLELDDDSTEVWVEVLDFHRDFTSLLPLVINFEVNPETVWADGRERADQWDWRERIIDLTVSDGPETATKALKHITALTMNVSSVLVIDRRSPDAEMDPSMHQSVNFSTISPRGKGAVQLYEFDRANRVIIGPLDENIDDNDDLVVRQDVGGTKRIKYATASTIGDWLYAYADNFSNTICGGWSVNIHDSYQIEHTELDFSGSISGSRSDSNADLNRDHDGRYLFNTDHGDNTKSLTTSGTIQTPRLQGATGLSVGAVAGVLDLTGSTGVTIDAALNDVTITAHTDVCLDATVSVDIDGADVLINASTGDVVVAAQDDVTITATDAISLHSTGVLDVEPGGGITVDSLPGVSGTLTFGGGSSGEVATLTFTHGILTGRTLVA